MECKKNRFGKPAQPPQRLAVLGAGLMGAGIVQVHVPYDLSPLSGHLVCVCIYVHVHVHASV